MILVLSILAVIYLTLYFFGIPYNIEPYHFYTTNSIIYLIITMWYMHKYKRESFICFEFLFGLSYWLACFFVVFVLDEMESGRALTQMEGFNEILLCRSCVMCMLGYLFYMLGLCINRDKELDFRFYNIKQNPSVNTILNLITTFCIVLFFLLGGYNFINAYDQSIVSIGLDGDRFGRFGSALTYSTILLNISTVSNILSINRQKSDTLVSFLGKINKLYMFNLLLMSIFLLICGYRSGAMQIILPFIALLSLRRIISAKVSLLFLAVGACMLALIGLLRSNIRSMGEVSEGMSLALFFRDFNSANAAVPSLIEYVDLHGPVYFSNALSQILAIIPFAQSIFIGAFGNDILAISSSNLYTNEISSSYFSGMGTNVIGDLYYTGGLLCVLVLMFCLGWIIKRVSQSRNRYMLVIFAIMVGNAVFMARVEYFYIARSCAFAVIIYWFVNCLASLRDHANHKC